MNSTPPNSLINQLFKLVKSVFKEAAGPEVQKFPKEIREPQVASLLFKRKKSLSICLGDGTAQLDPDGAKSVKNSKLLGSNSRFDS